MGITVEHIAANGDNKPRAMNELTNSEAFIVITISGGECHVTTNVARTYSVDWMQKVITAWSVNQNPN